MMEGFWYMKIIFDSLMFFLLCVGAHAAVPLQIDPLPLERSLRCNNVLELLSPTMKEWLFGKEVAHLPIHELVKVETCDAMIARSKKKLHNTKSVVAVAAKLKPYAEVCFENLYHKISGGWCRSFEQLDALPEEDFPKDWLFAKALYRIFLFLAIPDIELEREDWMPEHFLLREHKPESFFSHLRENIWTYVNNRDRLDFVLVDMPFLPLVDYLVAVAQGRSLVPIPTNLGKSKDVKAYGYCQGFGSILRCDLDYAYARCQNIPLLHSLQPDLDKDIAQEFLDDMRANWRTNGVQSMLLGFHLSCQCAFAQDCVKKEFVLKGNIGSMINRRSIVRDTIENAIMQRCFGEVFGNLDFDDVDDVHGAEVLLHSLLEDKLKNIFACRVPFNIGAQQAIVRERLEEEWGITKVNADFNSYQEVVMNIVQFIVKQDIDNLDMQYFAPSLLRFFAYPCPNQEVFFVLFDDIIPEKSGVYNAGDWLVVSVPLRDKVERMTAVERKCLLVTFMGTKTTYMGAMCSVYNVPYIFGVKFPFERNFPDAVRDFCDNWLYKARILDQRVDLPEDELRAKSREELGLILYAQMLQYDPIPPLLEARVGSGEDDRQESFIVSSLARFLRFLADHSSFL